MEEDEKTQIGFAMQKIIKPCSDHLFLSILHLLPKLYLVTNKGRVDLDLANIQNFKVL